MITVFADQDLEESFIYSASLLLALESYCLRILCLPLLERLLPSGETDPRAPHRRLEVNLPDMSGPVVGVCKALAAVLAGKTFVRVLLFVFLQFLLGPKELGT